jgi:DNA-binding IclR family transcriptional regulator
MVRPAPAVVRATEALDFLAAHPGQGFTLSELSKSLDINMASMLAILQALVDAGYVVRQARHKTYGLGPSLVALGYAAVAQHQALAAAAEPMRALAAETGTECVASTAVGEDMVMVATEGLAPAEARDIRVGQRIPMIPPLGAVFVAWAPAEVIDGWLDAASGDLLSVYRRLLETVGQRGYSLGSLGPASGPGVQLGRALRQQAAGRELDARIHNLVSELRSDYMVLDVDADVSYRVSAIAAPVFDAGGSVVLALTLNGFDGPLRGADVLERANRLVATTRSITKAIHGRRPREGRDPRA